jgi:hypothetical protein
MMYGNFRLLFILANPDYSTQVGKKYPNILKTRHSKTDHLKMLVESLYVYTVGTKYKSHNNQCPKFQDYRYKFICHNLIKVKFGHHISIKTSSIKFNRKSLLSLR